MPKKIENREQVVRDVVAGYGRGESVRQLAAVHGLSYGSVHRMLSEDPNVVLRSRGGAVRAKAVTPVKA